MQIYVEHHGWRWSKAQGYWSNTIVKKFGSKKAFDRYVEEQTLAHPGQAITYFIYENINDQKGDVLAHLEYNGRQYTGTKINDKWLQFK